MEVETEAERQRGRYTDTDRHRDIYSVRGNLETTFRPRMEQKIPKNV